MIIGILKESQNYELRVAATAETVKNSVKLGHSVLVEKSSGDGAFISDQDYENSGATIIESANEITLRVSPPVFIITAASTKKGTAVNKKFSDPMTVLWAKPINERSLKTKNSMVDAINENAIGTPIITSIAIIISESSAIIYHQE